MVNVCSLCGDPGYEEALSTCIKCNSASIHGYCTYPIEFEPFDWVCEDCPQSPKNVEIFNKRVTRSANMNPSASLPPKDPFQVTLRDPERIKRYKALKGRRICNTRYLDNETLETLGLREDIEWMAEQVGWTQFLTMKDPTYISLTLEFLSTVHVELPSKGPCHDALITFRLNNLDRELTMEQFNAIFGFRNGGDRTVNRKVFNANRFWYEITDEKEFDPTLAPSSLMYNPCFRIMQRLMAHTVFARGNNKGSVRTPELLHLWAMVQEGHNVDSGAFLALQLQAVGKAKKGIIRIGGIVTSIARFLGVDMEGLEEATGDNRIDLRLCRSMKMIEGFEEGRYKLRFSQLDGLWILPDPDSTTVKVHENWKRTFTGVAGDSDSDQARDDVGRD